MPSINLRKPLYDELIRRNEDPAERANRSVAEYLQNEYDVTIDA